MPDSSPHIIIPKLSLVMLVGVSGSGKSSFAQQHFAADEILSSDAIRHEVLDNVADQSDNHLVFNILAERLRNRLHAGLLTVVDATNLAQKDRNQLLRIAKDVYVKSYAIVLDLPLDECLAANAQRSRQVPADIIEEQHQRLQKQYPVTGKRSFRRVFTYRSRDSINAVQIERRKMRSDFQSLTGPFDIIGDVHGCFDELCQLITKLGYELTSSPHKNSVDTMHSVQHAEQRTLVFVGDLVDRGPASVPCLKLVRDLCEQGQAYCVAGNHEARLRNWLEDGSVKLTHGLATTAHEFSTVSADLRQQLTDFIAELPTYMQLDHGQLLIAHAGLQASMHGREGGKVVSFCLYGDTGKGAKDEFGLPIRRDWAQDYTDDTLVVHGHVPMLKARHLNNTWCIDTGCAFGGELTALRYPEKILVAVPAIQQWAKPTAPLRMGY